MWDIIWAFNRPGDAKKITILGNAHLEFGATLRYSEIDHLVNATHEVWNLGWSNISLIVLSYFNESYNSISILRIHIQNESRIKVFDFYVIPNKIYISYFCYRN